MASLRETIPLQKSKVVKKSLGATIGLIIFAAFISIFVAVFLFGDLDLEGMPQILINLRGVVRILLPLLFVLLLCLTPFYQYLYFKRYFYDIDGSNIRIRKGVFAQKEITLPFSRITDVYVDQDLIDVIFGLYDVHMSSPTEQSGLFAHIDGVNKAGSQQLREMILEKMNKEES